MTDLRKTLAGDGLETVGEVQQFGLEMIEAKTRVIVIALFRFGILRVVERRTHAPGDVESAGDAEHAE